MAEHVLELLNIILTEKYKILSNSSGKPIIPSSEIYKDVSNDFENKTGKKLSPKYIYTMLQGDRYNVWKRFLNYHGIEQHSISMLDVSESTLHDSCNNEKIELKLILPFKTWLAMSPEEVKYADKELSERTYNVLFRRVWTDVLFEQLWQQIRIPCALSFKRCKMSDSGIFLKIVATCSECNCNFSGMVANKPVPLNDVIMECIIENFDASIKHKKKRHLKGNRRIEISNKMLEGNILPCIWRRNEANKIMKFGDPEPAHLPKNQILSKAKQEREKINLALTTSDPLQNLQCMKYNQFAGQIHAIGLDPFYVHYWTPEQAAIFVQNSEYICIDGTGSLVKKLKKPSGELSSHIYLYQIVTKTNTSHMPVFQMLSASQNTNTIHFWLIEIIRIGMKHKSNFPLPKQVVCDFDRALIGAIVRAFCQCKNLQDYLSQCFICLSKKSKNLPPTFLRLDVSHFIHMVSRWKELKFIHPQARLFYITIMAFLTKISDFVEFQEIAKCAIVLANSEMFGNTKDNIPSYSELCFKKLHTVVTQNTVPCEIIDGKKDETKHIFDSDASDTVMEETIQSKSDITAWLTTFSTECIAMATDNAIKNPGCNVNPYYSVGIGKRIISLLLYFPLYSNVMMPIFTYGSSTATSSAVEAEFNDCKHRLLKNILRPMRVDKFITLHLQSFSGRAKLAVAEQIPENKTIFEYIENKLENETRKKEIDSDIPCTLFPQQNPTCTDVQLTDITRNENLETNRDTINVETYVETSQTEQISNTDKKENYECDTVLSETSESEYSDLNNEHNWRNKNDRRTLKRTYLQPRPDFIGVCKRKKIDIAILQNGNLCESLKDRKDRLIVLNTCGFDSIVQLFAAACIHADFYNFLINATSDIFQFIKNFIDKGSIKSIYKQRATILRKIEYFVSKNVSNTITVNADSNICNLCEYLLIEQPSCTLQKECGNCKKATTKNLTLINLDFQIIQSYGYNAIAKAIQDYLINNYKECKQCGGNVELRTNYHSHLLIECIGDKNVQVALKIFPKTLTLHNASFSLIGVIHYNGGCASKSGHYVAYALYGDKWILFDDLLKKHQSITENNTVNPVICVYIKMN